MQVIAIVIISIIVLLMIIFFIPRKKNSENIAQSELDKSVSDSIDKIKVTLYSMLYNN